MSKTNNIQRYNKLDFITEPREIVLLKSFPCKWQKCTFCDYIHDNSQNEKEMINLNKEIIENITGCYNKLEVINSGSCFELPKQTLYDLRNKVKEKNITKLYFEAHWIYRKRLNEIRHFFKKSDIIFITGIETFNDEFRNKVLKKGIIYQNIEEIKKYFQSVCIMVGIQGQTKDMIAKDIDILINNFEHGTVNLFVNNSTSIKADIKLQNWFKKEFEWLNDIKKIDILWKNTDFGVGSKL